MHSVIKEISSSDIYKVQLLKEAYPEYVIDDAILEKDYDFGVDKIDTWCKRSNIKLQKECFNFIHAFSYNVALIGKVEDFSFPLLNFAKITNSRTLIVTPVKWSWNSSLKCIFGDKYTNSLERICIFITKSLENRSAQIFCIEPKDFPDYEEVAHRLKIDTIVLDYYHDRDSSARNISRLGDAMSFFGIQIVMKNFICIFKEMNECNRTPRDGLRSSGINGYIRHTYRDCMNEILKSHKPKSSGKLKLPVKPNIIKKIQTLGIFPDFWLYENGLLDKDGESMYISSKG